MTTPDGTRSELSERRNAILSLLDARFDGLPEPRSVTLRTQPGFVHRTLAPTVCETCEGVDSYGCTGCGGRGSVERMRERDPMAKDVVLPYGMTPDRKEAELARDRQLAVLRDQTRPAATIDEAEDAKNNPFAWERARARLYASTDMACLDREIEWLRDHFPGVKLRSGCRGSGLSGCFTVGYLDMVLPDPLRAPAAKKVPEKARVRGPVRPEAGPKTLAMRDAEMRERAVEGAKPAEIAAEFRVSIRTVYRAVNQEAA